MQEVVNDSDGNKQQVEDGTSSQGVGNPGGEDGQESDGRRPEIDEQHNAETTNEIKPDQSIQQQQSQQNEETTEDAEPKEMVSNDLLSGSSSLSTVIQPGQGKGVIHTLAPNSLVYNEYVMNKNKFVCSRMSNEMGINQFDDERQGTASPVMNPLMHYSQLTGVLGDFSDDLWKESQENGTRGKEVKVKRHKSDCSSEDDKDDDKERMTKLAKTNND